MQWLRRSFITGFFVMVPLAVSCVAVYWVVRFADRMTSGLGERLIDRHIPGLGIIVGIIATALIVLAVGAVATNVIGRRVLQRGESILLQVPLFRTIYAPVKQLISAFSPDNESGFKRVVMIEDQARGFVLGFLTKEFTVDRGHGPERLLAVYVPTNHLYLGDILVCSPDRATFPDLSVEEGIRIFLTGGMALPERMRLDRPHSG